MTNLLHKFRFQISAILLLCAPPACKKEIVQADPTPKAADVTKPSQSKAAVKPASSGGSVARIAERVPQKLNFDTLVQILGEKLTPDMLKQIESNDQRDPGIPDILGKEAKAYVIALQDDGGLVIHTVDDCEIAFGYAFHAPSQAVSDDTEKPYLNDFKFSGDIKIEVLDVNFDTTQIVVKKYVSKSKDNIQAVTYTHQGNRTLTFFDSSKVDALKILPSPPSAVGKDTIDRVKAMLKNGGK